MLRHRGGPQSTRNGLEWPSVFHALPGLRYSLCPFTLASPISLSTHPSYWKAPVWVSWQLVFAVEVWGGLVDASSITKSLYSIRPQNEFSIARTPFSQSRVLSPQDRSYNRNFDPGIHSCAHLRVPLDKARFSSTSSRVTGRDSPANLGHDGFGTWPMVVVAIAGRYLTVTILGTLEAQGVPPGEILRLEPSSISPVESNLGSSLIFKSRHTAIFPSSKVGVEQNARIELRAGLAVSRESLKVDRDRLQART